MLRRGGVRGLAPQGWWSMALVVVLSHGVNARAGARTDVVDFQPASSDARIIEGITMPSKEAIVGTIMRGRIARVPVREGATVAQGDLLFSLADDVQRVRVRIAKAACESLLEIELATARKNKADRDMDRLMNLYGDKSASSKELSDARAASAIATLETSLAQFRHEQAIRSYERELAVLEEHRARAPYAAYVSQQMRHVGDTVDENEGVIEIAQLDPLITRIDCPFDLASTIHVGDLLMVRSAHNSRESRLGKVVFISRVADGASQTFRVKLSLDNEDATWASGQRVEVLFPSVPAVSDGAPGSGDVIER